MRDILYWRLWQFSTKYSERQLFLCNVIAHSTRYRALIFATNAWRYLNYSYHITLRNLCAVHLSGAYHASSVGIWVFFYYCWTFNFCILAVEKIRGSYGEQNWWTAYVSHYTHTSCTMIASKRRDSWFRVVHQIGQQNGNLHRILTIRLPKYR